jgi:PAS domain S-box-containing protein
MPQIVWTARADGQIDYLNRRWTEFTGLSQTVSNDAWSTLLHPDEAAEARRLWAGSLQRAEPFEMSIRLLDRRTRTYRWHLLRTVAVKNERGQVLRWFGTATDINEQKRAEESARYLAEASAILASVDEFPAALEKLANLAVPSFADWSAVDIVKDGRVARLAVAHRDPARVEIVRQLMREYPPDPQAPRGGAAVLRTGHPELLEDIPDALLEQNAIDARHLDLLRSLGLRSFIAVPLLDSTGAAFGVLTFAMAESGRRYAGSDLQVAMDLARRTAMAVENTTLYQALRDSDRRKDEFLAILAHELRNPLAPISNSLDVLAMPGIDTATARRATEIMTRQVRHLVRLVDDLMDVSRAVRGKIELRRTQVDLATILEQAVETLQPLARAQGHQLRLELPSSPLIVEADPVRLTQIVCNLLTNAMKYTPGAGRIGLSADRAENAAVIRVSDTGIGIEPGMRDRIFDMFVQGDHRGVTETGGLGIGLTLVKTLVHAHDGTVEARSEGPGRGSEFEVRLPLSAAAAQPVSSPRAPEPELRDTSCGHRVLVVDDNQDAAESLATLLRFRGHDVRVEHSGEAAVAAAETYAPHAIFLDIGMPGIDGYEVARRIRSRPGADGVVLAALTGWGQQADRRRSMDAGFNHHIVKPPEPGAVEHVLLDVTRQTRRLASNHRRLQDQS